MPEGELRKVVHREITKVINQYNKWLRKNYKEEWQKQLKKIKK